MAPVGGRITSRFGPRLPGAAGLLVAASGAHSGYADLLPAFLLWGIGCGLLTPAVVAAAIATAFTPSRSARPASTRPPRRRR